MAVIKFRRQCNDLRLEMIYKTQKFSLHVLEYSQDSRAERGELSTTGKITPRTYILYSNHPACIHLIIGPVS